jgi:hypothetical protein
MTAPGPVPVAPPDAAARIGLGWWLAILAVALACRLWRIEAVGEGVDEGHSVETTRAMADGRFSFSSSNDFQPDAFAARFQPVAEAVAVPFLRVLGDRPLAYRLPWLLASMALLVALVRHAAGRHGRTAAVVVGALYALDYRAVYYAQTHRYGIATQALAFALYLATARALRRETLAAWGVAFLLGLMLLHAHLMGVLVVLALAGAAGPAKYGWRAPQSRRGARGSGATFLLILLSYGFAVLLVMRAEAGSTLYRPQDASLLAGVARSASSTVRTLFGLGLVAAPLALLGAVRLVRSAAFEERAVGLAVLVVAVLWLPLGVFFPLEPRYVTCLQPLLLLAAGTTAARLLDSLATRPGPRGAAFALAVAATAAPTALYLATGGTRDVETPILEALAQRAQPGDVVLWDVGSRDAFRRRPPGLGSAPRDAARSQDGAARLDALRVRWLVRPKPRSDAARYAGPVEARLEEVAASTARGLFQEPLTLALYRVAP